MSVPRIASTGGMFTLVRRPAGIAERTRWLFGCLAMLSLILSLPQVLFGANGGVFVLGTVAAVTLAGSWTFGYLTRRVPLALDVLEALAIAGFALACPEPGNVLGILFGAVWYRALYGSTARAFVRACLYAAALGAALFLWPVVHGGAAAPSPTSVLGALPTLFLTVFVARQLGIALQDKEEGMQRDNALATMGSQLLGITDPDMIRDLGWQAATEICKATPGLRMIKAVRDGSTLRIERIAGSFHAAPTELPGSVIAGESGSTRARIENPEPLNAAVGTGMVWDCIALSEQEEETWLVVGGPRKLPPAVSLAMHSLVIQVALAMRNSDVHQQLTVQAQFDALTGLENRASFTAKLSNNLSHRVQTDGLHVLFLDLDDFKDVNDALGHRAGDAVLVEAAGRLRRRTRPDDICARLGGDEFAIVLHGATAAAAAEIAERMVKSLGEPVVVGEHTIRVGASVGLATATPDIEIHELVHQADVAMYAAKANGKGRVQIFEAGLLRAEVPYDAIGW